MDKIIFHFTCPRSLCIEMIYRMSTVTCVEYRVTNRTPFWGTIPHFAISYPRKFYIPGVYSLYPIWIFELFLSQTDLFVKVNCFSVEVVSFLKEKWLWRVLLISWSMSINTLYIHLVLLGYFYFRIKTKFDELLGFSLCFTIFSIIFDW